MTKPYPWPEAQMVEWYNSGLNSNEIANKLGGPEWQEYWLKNIGKQYFPNHKQVWKVLDRTGQIVRRKSGPSRPENHGSWKGGRLVDKHGYILVYQPHHPYATKAGRVREHRLVMEKILGRFLLPTEVVHHIDDNPANNDPENLRLYSSNGEHLGETLKGKCPQWTPDGRQRIIDAKAKSQSGSKPHGQESP